MDKKWSIIRFIVSNVIAAVVTLHTADLVAAYLHYERPGDGFGSEVIFLIMTYCIVCWAVYEIIIMIEERIS